MTWESAPPAGSGPVTSGFAGNGSGPDPSGFGPTLSRPRYRPATFTDVLRSEWTKFRSVRSSYWSLLVAAALGIGLGALISGISASHYDTDPGVRSGWNPTDMSLGSLGLAQLAFGVLGVMVITGEYSSGLIRTSLAAVPRRGRLLAAKAAVFTAVALVAGLIIAFVTFLVGQALISGQAPSASLGQHEVLRVVIGSGLYLALLGLFRVAFGALRPHAAAGIAVLVAILFVLPGVAHALPNSWERPITKYWPTNAGRQVAQMVPDSHSLTPWLGFLDMGAFVALVLIGALLVLETRDA
jgi:ABC-2 type transport system permease protein